MIDPLQYYSQPRVLREATRYLAGRWIAVHCQKRLRDGRPMLIRYRRGKPLSASTPQQLEALIKSLGFCTPRAIYGTAAVFARITSREDLAPSNMAAYTPTWDIDSQPQHWRETLSVAKAIVEALADLGVSDSVWLKWSGRGMHVHVNEKAVSPQIYGKYTPLDVAYSIVDYVLQRARKRIVEAAGGAPIKVENLIDPQRVFTAPLSLHRTLDKACVPLKPDDIPSFTPHWTDPLNPRYNEKWHTYTPGEADKLALKALRAVGGYPGPQAQPATPRRVEAHVEAAATHAAPTPEELDIPLNPEPPPPSARPPKTPDDVLEQLSTILSRYALALDPRPHTLSLLHALAENTRLNPATRSLYPTVKKAISLVKELEPTQLRALLKPPRQGRQRPRKGLEDFL